MATVKEMIDTVNSLLQGGEPQNISVDSYSGYTGYKPQAIIDAMNEVFDIGSWGFEEMSNEVETGEKGGLVIAQVRVWLKDVDFKPTGYGQSRVTKGDIGDAKKGAQTDAIKKALSYYSIGNRAYLGLLADPTKQNNGQRQVNQQRPNPQQTRPQAPTPIKPTQPQTAQSDEPHTEMPQTQKNGNDVVKARMNELYPRAVALGVCKNASSFLAYIAQQLHKNKVSTETLTLTELETIATVLAQEEKNVA